MWLGDHASVTSVEAAGRQEFCATEGPQFLRHLSPDASRCAARFSLRQTDRERETEEIAR